MGVEDVAQARVALNYDPLQASAERRLAANQAHTAATQTGLENWGTTGAQGIDTSYNHVDDYLGQNRTASGNMLHEQMGDINQVVNGAYNVADANRTQSRNYLDNYMRVGGLQGGQAAQAMSPLLAALDRNANSSLTSGANLQGAMQNWANQFDQSQGRWQEIAKLTRAGKQGDFKTAVAQAIGDNNLQGQKNENDLNATLTDLLGQRGNSLTDEIDRLNEQAWQHQLAQAQLDSTNQNAAHSDALGYARLAFDREKQGTTDWQNLQQMGLQRSQDTRDFGYKQTSGLEAQALDLYKASITGQLISDPEKNLALYNRIRQNLGLPPMAYLPSGTGPNGGGDGQGSGQGGNGNGSNNTPKPPDLAGIDDAAPPTRPDQQVPGRDPSSWFGNAAQMFNPRSWLR